MNTSAPARAAGSVAIRVVACESTSNHRRRAHRARRSRVIATAAAEGAEEANDPTQTPAGPAAVRFGIRAELDYGEALIVVGGAKELGSWEPESGFALTWSDGNVWQGDLATLTNDAPENSVHSTAVEFKLVVVKPDWGGYWWEEGENRLIDMELVRTGCEVSGAFGGHVKVNAVEGGATPAAGSEPLTHAQKAAQRAVANVQEYPEAVMQAAPPPPPRKSGRQGHPQQSRLDLRGLGGRRALCHVGGPCTAAAQSRVRIRMPLPARDNLHAFILSPCDAVLERHVPAPTCPDAPLPAPLARVAVTLCA